MKTGIILSGGGARGFAHIGVLKALNEMGIGFDMISAVSSGAVIGAYLASGFRFDEILKNAKETELFSFMDVRFLKSGLFKTDAIRKSLEKYFDGYTFEMLKTPLVIVATDFQNGKPAYFSKGNLVRAILASSAIPGLYQPVEIDGILYVDGGLLNNFPIEPLAGLCKFTIGIHVNPLEKKDVHLLSIPSVIDRSFHLAVGNAVRSKQHECTVFIEPPELYRFGVFDMDNADEIFKIGYDFTMGMEKEIEKRLNLIV